MKKLIITNTYDVCRSGEPKVCVVMIHGIASDSTTYNEAHEFFETEESLKDVKQGTEYSRIRTAGNKAFGQIHKGNN